MKKGIIITVKEDGNFSYEIKSLTKSESIGIVEIIKHTILAEVKADKETHTQ